MAERAFRAGSPVLISREGSDKGRHEESVLPDGRGLLLMTAEDAWGPLAPGTTAKWHSDQGTLQVWRASSKGEYDLCRFHRGIPSENEDTDDTAHPTCGSASRGGIPGHQAGISWMSNHGTSCRHSAKHRRVVPNE